MDYTQITAGHEKSMLAVIGVSTVEELFAPIPAAHRLKRPLTVPPGLSELEMLADAQQLAARNRHTGELVCFAGCGAYDHFIPTIVDHLAMRGEFLTAYTPYQAEASQGTLQAFYEFQTFVCELTGMDVANASLYESASAAAEAVQMARSATGRTRVVVAGSCHPDIGETLAAYAAPQRYEVVTVPHKEGLIAKRDLHDVLGDNTAAVVLAFPNFFGSLDDLAALIEETHKHGAMAIVAYDPIAAGLLKRPGDLGADIVIGEGQALGIPLQYGAPYLGFMAARESFLRKMPGRMVGVAYDDAGKRGFALVLQTREQHIKREKATSNVCTNQGLMAMRATVYMAAMGKHGIQQAASLSFDKAHYAAAEIAKLSGYKLRFAAPFFKEFVVQSKKPVDQVLKHCKSRGILAGVSLGRWFKDLNDCFTLAVTEKRTRQEIDALVAALKEA